MPNETRTVREIAADVLIERREAAVDAAVERLGRPSGAREMPLREQRDAFWHRAVSPEDEAALWAQGKTPTEISGAVYPRRWELFSDHGGELPEKVSWAKRLADLGPPDEVSSFESPTSFESRVSGLESRVSRPETGAAAPEGYGTGGSARDANKGLGGY